MGIFESLEQVLSKAISIQPNRRPSTLRTISRTSIRPIKVCIINSLRLRRCSHSEVEASSAIPSILDSWVPAESLEIHFRASSHLVAS